MLKMPELFGSKVFNDAVMKKRLTPETYATMKKTIDEGKPLDASVADQVAQVKARTEDAIYKPDREAAIIQRQSEGIEEKFLKEYHIYY